MRKQKLMTKEIEKKIPALYAQESKGMDATVYLKLFHPYGAGTWYITEYDPGQRLGFGWCDLGQGGELGYVSFDELESLKHKRFGFQLIERDAHFSPCLLKDCIKEGV